MGRGDPAEPVGLVRISDLAGRPRGTAFLADHEGTLVTAHEAVAGLGHLVLHAPGRPTWFADADAVVPLPEHGLALIRTDGLGLRPLPLATRASVVPGTYVRIAAQGWREARVLGPATVTYATAVRAHLVPGALELAIGTEGAEALRPGRPAAGGPVVDSATGTVLGVVGTLLRGDPRAAGHALPIRPHGPLGALLHRNGATIPAYGPDLNLAAVLELTATTALPAREPSPWPAPVARPAAARVLTGFAAPDGPGDRAAPVLTVVGAPGSGRTTLLGAVCEERGRGAAPAPTVRLRGADLGDEDDSVAEAVGRALHRAARIAAASGTAGDTTDATPERVADLAREAGRPLLVVLDGPEEMPPRLAHRLADWTRATERWLRAHGARLVLACRPEYGEQSAALWSAPPAVLPLGDLTEAEARAVRQGYGLGDEDLDAADARHPLALRLLAEVRAALPGEVPGRPGRAEIFTAHLDLVCLRIAVRIAAGTRPLPGGSAVRRLAARVTGQVHEAARRCLGPGHGLLDRASFEELFPWRDGWAPAVLTEGLLVPAGSGYRFAHEELADWLQAAHLDLDAALHALVHRGHEAPPEHLPSGDAAHPPQRPQPAAGPAPAGPPVPRHRVGPVLQALLLAHREGGPAALAPRLTALADSLARFGPEAPEDAVWWGSGLLTRALEAAGDLRPYLPVLRHLADRVGETPGRPRALAAFGPAWWRGLPVPEDERLDLLRRALTADPPKAPEPAGPPGADPASGEEGFLDVVVGMLADDPRGTQPELCRWFTDGRALPSQPYATVAGFAQTLLHAHRGLAVDDLCDALVATAHPLADGLLGALVDDERAAVCRAVDRWARDDGRPERRVAAALYGSLLAARGPDGRDRELLRHAATALLARAADRALHGAALGMLVRDPSTRGPYLDRALADPRVPADALVEALPGHPGPVLDALRERLHGAGPRAADVLRALAAVDAPALTREIAALVGEYAARHPEGAGHVAAYVDRRFEEGPTARAVLFPLVAGLVRSRPGPVRRALAPVLAAPGTGASRHLRAELLDVLIDHETRAGTRGDPAVPDALLTAAAEGAARRPALRTRDLVARAAALHARDPGGGARHVRLLAALAADHPAFAALLTETVPAPRAPAPPMPMRTDGPGHGSLRPA
ncbi:trypsin-like peptidase domain-containing protein [Streptomyces filamentosus]|uniref:trypsin-like peptidase domain-containing protein n=1 Tax=Streptomyces filamentosus TaxID=67294 RepID=UPI0037D3B0D8